MISEVQVRLSGGVGNQIFQFFAGKMVAEKFDCGLSADVSMLNHPNAHFGSDIRELAFFESDGEVEKNTVHPFQHFTVRFQAKLAKGSIHLSRFFKIYSKEQIDFKALENFTEELRISGYFQTRQVVDYIKDQYPNLNLRPKEITPRFASALQQVEGDFCAIHIRRGDYLRDNSIHSELTSNYYSSALNTLAKNRKGKALKYVVFSDEPQFARSLLPENLNYIEAAKFQLSIMEEFYLMSFARAFIIANSTFSFWPAFLAKNDCLVVVPKYWFKSRDRSVNEIFPSHWILITN